MQSAAPSSPPPGSLLVPAAAAGPPNRGEGFFQEYLSRLRTSLSPEEWRQFSSLCTYEQRVTFVGRLPGAADPQWPVDLTWAKKDPAEAKTFKEKGNQAFLKGDFVAALDLYSKCALKTPYGNDFGTAELAVATANRSAALYRLGKYRKALEDIETALNMDFPKGLRHKVLDRKARCLLALAERRKFSQEASRKARDGAMSALRDTLTALDEATDLDAERRGQRETEVRLMLCVLTKGAEKTSKAQSKPSRRSEAAEQQQVDEAEEDDEESGCGGHSGALPAPTGGRHPLYPGASRLLTFARRGAAGRQAEAKATVSAGDVLVSERALAAVLLRQKTASHCFECFKPLLAPVPCPSCCAVSFCSVACRTAALGSHHGSECGALPVLWASGASLTCHIALRLISQRDVQFFRDLRPHIAAAREAVAASEGTEGGGEGGTSVEEKVFWSSELSATQKEYMSVLRLVTHDVGRSAEDHFQRAVMAVFLVKCLREWGEFFEEAEEETTNSASKDSRSILNETNGETLNEDDVVLGSLLSHHLQMTQFNAHEVFELEVGDREEARTGGEPQAEGGQKDKDMISEEADAGVWRSVGLGGALFPTLSLFNHSCEPGVIRYFKGNSVIVKAIRSARPGEMVAENYGPIYTRHRLQERQTQLRTRYWFDCKCRPCRESWPLFEEMPETGMGPLRFRCPTTIAPAAKAGNKPAPTSCSQGFVVVQTDTMTPVITCNGCGVNVNIMKGLKVLSETGDIFAKAEEKLKSLMNQGASSAGRKQWKSQVEEALFNFLKVLHSLEAVLAPPFRDVALCQQSARRCMLALGNVRQCGNQANTAANGVVS